MRVNHLPELECLLQDLHISKNDVCIVGSAVLSLYDIRQNKDIDIIINHKDRQKVTKDPTAAKLSDNIECVATGWLYCIDNKTTDEDIIYNSQNHFINEGFKFCTMELVTLRKTSSTKDKDKKDLILINDKC